MVSIFPKDWRPLSLQELDEVLIAHGITSEMSMPDGFEMVSDASDWEHSPEDCQFTPTLFSGIRPTNNPPKSRHGWLLQQLVLINAAHRNGCITANTHRELYELVDQRFQEFLKLPPKRPLNHNEVASANKWALARVETFSEEKLARNLGTTSTRILEKATQSASLGSLQVMQSTRSKSWLRFTAKPLQLMGALTQQMPADLFTTLRVSTSLSLT